MNAHLPTLIWLTLTGAMLLAAGCGSDRPTATPASAALVTPAPTATVLPTSTFIPSPTPAPTFTPTPASPSGHDDVPMVEIPAGEFIMGLTLEQATTLKNRWQDDFGKIYHEPNEESFYDSLPQMRVYLDSFKIDLVEVTQERYQACRDAGVCSNATFEPTKEVYPILVDPDNAQKYCEWVGKRLPTEAEWEKAARGTDGRLFPWGNEWNIEDRVGTEVGAVGSHLEDVSPYGVLDMAGSLGEWTLSLFKAYPGHPHPELFATEAPVARGLYFFVGYPEDILWRGAVTARRDQTYTNPAGFRCVEAGKPIEVAEAVVDYQPVVSSPPPTVATVDLNEMVEVPAGSFLRGIDETTLTTEEERNAYHNAIPQQSVYLDLYYIDRYPVTVAQFAEFLNILGQHRFACGGWDCADVYEGPGDFGAVAIYHEKKQYLAAQPFGDYPIEEVSWYGAQTYCSWLGKRLPTEAEWEKAARGTDARRYPWGNNWDDRADEKNVLYSRPIGLKPFLASPYGVEDLIHPSVGEWVADWYAPDYYISDASTNNPQGPDEGETKVKRGDSIKWGVFYREDSATFASFRCAYTPPDTH